MNILQCAAAAQRENNLKWRNFSFSSALMTANYQSGGGGGGDIFLSICTFSFPVYAAAAAAGAQKKLYKIKIYTRACIYHAVCRETSRQFKFHVRENSFWLLRWRRTPSRIIICEAIFFLFTLYIWQFLNMLNCI